MSIFDQIGEKITSTGQETITKAKNFTETTKLNSKISDLERQISLAFTGIGRAYYESHKDDPAVEFPDRIEQISQLYKEIQQYKEQIQKIKGTPVCQACGAPLLPGALFCNACGQKIQKEPPAAEPRPSAAVCPNCHAPVSEGAAFCASCGTPLHPNP